MRDTLAAFAEFISNDEPQNAIKKTTNSRKKITLYCWSETRNRTVSYFHCEIACLKMLVNSWSLIAMSTFDLFSTKPSFLSISGCFITFHSSSNSVLVEEKLNGGLTPTMAAKETNNTTGYVIRREPKNLRNTKNTG